MQSQFEDPCEQRHSVDTKVQEARKKFHDTQGDMVNAPTDPVLMQLEKVCFE